jgi:hypothetical protein
MIFFGKKNADNAKKNPAATSTAMPSSQTHPGTAHKGMSQNTTHHAPKTETADVPVLLEMLELGTTSIAIEAVVKLMLERERHHMLLAKLEQHEFPEIAARCQTEIQAYLHDNLARFSENVGEHMGNMLRAELRLAMMHMISTEKIS